MARRQKVAYSSAMRGGSSARVVTYDWESGSDIKEELWNIFTYYCLCDDPSRIDTMTMRAFSKMFADSQLLGLERREIGDEDCNVVYVRTSGATANRLMDYETFVNALTILAKKIFWDISRGDDAFREALIEYILPHAHRRRPQAVCRQMMQPDVVAVFKPVRTALVRIFEFYGTVLDEPKVKGDFGWERIGEREAKVWYTKTRQKVGPLARPRIKALVPKPVTSARRGPHNMAAAMFFNAWKRFAVDFGLDDILSQMDLAEVFLASSKARKGRGFLKYNQFCEGLMRCALISSRSGASSSASWWHADSACGVTSPPLTHSPPLSLLHTLGLCPTFPLPRALVRARALSLWSAPTSGPPGYYARVPDACALPSHGALRHRLAPDQGGQQGEGAARLELPRDADSGVQNFPACRHKAVV